MWTVPCARCLGATPTAAGGGEPELGCSPFRRSVPLARTLLYRAALVGVVFGGGAAGARACPHCRVEARAEIRADTPAATAALVLLPLALVGGAAALVYHSDRLGHDGDE